jgi:hypothetical protein
MSTTMSGADVVRLSIRPLGAQPLLDAQAMSPAPDSKEHVTDHFIALAIRHQNAAPSADLALGGRIMLQPIEVMPDLDLVKAIRLNSIEIQTGPKREGDAVEQSFPLCS